MTGLAEVLILFFVLASVSFVAFRKRSLDFFGILAANALGIMVFVGGGLPLFLAFTIVFFAAETVTRVSRLKRKGSFEARSMGNIFGNGLVATLAALSGSPLAFFGAVSAALADTFSSELGSLSSDSPVMITDFRRVPAGTDGGITFLGLLVACAGGLLVGAMHFFVFASLPLAFIVFLCGFFGSVFDSFLGAVFQGKGLLDNNSVNFFATVFGALLALAMGWFFAML